MINETIDVVRLEYDKVVVRVARYNTETKNGSATSLTFTDKAAKSLRDKLSGVI